jgi:hypothetical protein
VTIPAAEEFRLTKVADLRKGDIVIDPRNEAGWTVEEVTPVSESGHFYRVRAGAFYLDWTPSDAQFYAYRPEPDTCEGIVPPNAT